MARFTEAEREQGMDMLEAAEQQFVMLGAPSRLGTAILNACVQSAGVDTDSPAYGMVAGASLMGYACRLAEPTGEPPNGVGDAIKTQIIFTESGEVAYEAMAEDVERFRKVVELVAGLADDADAIAALANVPRGAWEAFVTTAVYQLQKNLRANGVPKRGLPDGEVLSNLLRLGYAIRFADEIAGEKPMLKASLANDDRPSDFGALVIERGEGPPPTEPIDVEQWLSDTSVVCTHDFEPYAERVLEIVTLDLLGVLPMMDALLGETPTEEIGDDVVTTLSNARFGYALRNRETQLLGNSDYVARDDAVATLLEERWGGELVVDTAVIGGLLRDLCSFGFLGGPEGVYETTPGARAELRRNAIEEWADRYFPGESERTGRDITICLVQYGYVLHRLFEIHPTALKQ